MKETAQVAWFGRDHTSFFISSCTLGPIPRNHRHMYIITARTHTNTHVINSEIDAFSLTSLFISWPVFSSSFDPLMDFALIWAGEPRGDSILLPKDTCGQCRKRSFSTRSQFERIFVFEQTILLFSSFLMWARISGENVSSSYNFFRNVTYTCRTSLHFLITQNLSISTVLT